MHENWGLIFCPMDSNEFQQNVYSVLHYFLTLSTLKMSYGDFHHKEI